MKKTISFLLAVFFIVSSYMIIPSSAASGSGFIDVDESAWYYAAVDYVASNDIMSGTGENRFSPTLTLTRAMFARIIYNLSGEVAPTPTETDFTDIVEGSWYYDAVCWAKEKGVVNGTSATTFSPNLPVTREQIASMIVRYSAVMNLTDPQSEVEKFIDNDDISSWAVYPVYAARSANYIAGKGGNIFDPKGNATRAEAAQIIMNFEKNVLKIHTASEVVIPVKGITQTYTLLHVTDNHITNYDEHDNEEVAEYCKNREANFMSETADKYTSASRFEDYYIYAEQIGADNIILTGDNIDCPSHGNFSLLKTTLEKNDRLEKTVYCFGNHDWNYCNETNREEDILKHKEEFSFLLGDGDQTVGIYDMGEYVILSVANDNYLVNDEALNALNSLVYDEENPKPVIVMLHVPVFTPSIVDDTVAKWGRIITMGRVSEGYEQYAPLNGTTNTFVSLLENDEDKRVAAVIAGHVHFDHEDVLPGKNSVPQIVTAGGFDGSCRVIKLVPAE